MTVRIDASLPPDRWPAADAFLARWYRPDLALRDRALFGWQYRADRFGGHASMLTAWAADELIGILGYLTLPMFWGTFDEPVAGAWAMNWMVAEPHRTGTGWLLLRKLQDTHPVVFSIDASADNVRLVQRLRWTVSPHVPRWLAVLDERAIERFGWPGARPAVAARPSAAAARDLRPLPEAPGAYRPEWPLYEPLRYATIRSHEHLRWRYRDHPRFTYHVVMTGPDTRPAVCAYRVERAFERDGTAADTVGRVLDFFHPSDARGRSDGARLVTGVLAQLADAGCVYADFTTTSAEYAATLAAAGWIEEPAGTMLLPSRLSPIDRRARSLNLEYGVRAPWAGGDPARMYMTRADCDADRPVALAAPAPDPAATAASEDR